MSGVLFGNTRSYFDLAIFVNFVIILPCQNKYVKIFGKINHCIDELLQLCKRIGFWKVAFFFRLEVLYYCSRTSLEDGIPKE
jgi:hypothetical protein